MKRLECLDGLRGCLAVYVLLGHLAPFALLPVWVQVAVSHGGAAVDVFFILSGLVITQSILNTSRRTDAGTGTKAFLIGRVARIYPVFVLVFAFAVAVQLGSCGFDRMPWIGSDNAARTICVMAWPHAWFAEIIAHLTMTHGLFPNGMLPDVWVSFLGSAWSLSTEWQFYLLIILAVRHRQRLCWFLLGFAACGVVWRLLGPDAWQFSRAFLANKGHFFALGVASAPLVRREHGALGRYLLVLAGCLAVCATQESMGKILPPLAWTLCLVIQMRPSLPVLSVASRLLRSRAAQYLGSISYCLYMVNEPIHKLTCALLSRIADGDAAVFTSLWIPAAVGLPILASGWLHTHVEAPALRWAHPTGRVSALLAAAPSVQGRGRGL